MPPSAGAWHTTDAELKPDCGRAALRSSIITAIGRWAAALGETRTPSSGAGTRTGVAIGVRLGVGVAAGVGDGVAAGGGGNAGPPPQPPAPAGGGGSPRAPPRVAPR